MPVNIFTTIDHPLAVRATEGFGINDAGAIVGYFTNANTGQNSYVLSGGRFTTFDDPLAFPGGATFARGINDPGDGVGSFAGDSGGHGLLRSGGTYATIDIGVLAIAFGINNAGQIVGSFDDG